MKRSSRELIFFALLFLIFFLSVKTGKFWTTSGNAPSEDVVYLLIGISYMCIMIGIFHLANLSKSPSEPFWDISPAAKCKGGKYMWQGSSAAAVKCRELADSPQGRAMISAYNCAKGFIGVPKKPFQYTALSDDNWQDKRTEDSPDIELSDTGSLASTPEELRQNN